MTDGAQWFAIFSASTGDLVSTANVVTFPLATGLRAVTVDGDQAGRYWDKTTLNFVTTQPPPPPPPPPPHVVDPYPYREDWGTTQAVFTNTSTVEVAVTFQRDMFTAPPIVGDITVNSSSPNRGGSYFTYQVGKITQTGCSIFVRAFGPLNYTETITWHAVQRFKDRA